MSQITAPNRPSLIKTSTRGVNERALDDVVNFLKETYCQQVTGRRQHRQACSNVKAIFINNLNQPAVSNKPLHMLIRMFSGNALQLPTELNVALEFRKTESSFELVTEGNYRPGGKPFANAMYLIMSLQHYLDELHALRATVTTVTRQLSELPTIDTAAPTTTPFDFVKSYLQKGIQAVPAFVTSQLEIVKAHETSDNFGVLELVQQLKQDFQNMKLVDLLSATFLSADLILTRRPAESEGWLRCVQARLSAPPEFTLLELGNLFYLLVVQHGYCQYLRQHVDELETSDELKRLVREGYTFENCTAWEQKMTDIMNEVTRLNLKLEFPDVAALSSNIANDVALYQNAINNPAATRFPRITMGPRPPRALGLRRREVRFSDERPQQLLYTPEPIPVEDEPATPAAPEPAAAPTAPAVPAPAAAPTAPTTPAPGVLSRYWPSWLTWSRAAGPSEPVGQPAGQPAGPSEPAPEAPLVDTSLESYRRLRKELQDTNEELKRLKNQATELDNLLTEKLVSADAEMAAIVADMENTGSTKNPAYLELQRIKTEMNRTLNAANFATEGAKRKIMTYADLATKLNKPQIPFLEHIQTENGIVIITHRSVIDRVIFYEINLLQQIMTNRVTNILRFIEKVVRLKKETDDGRVTLKRLKEIETEMEFFIRKSNEKVTDIKQMSEKILEMSQILKTQIDVLQLKQANITVFQGEMALKEVKNKIFALEVKQEQELRAQEAKLEASEAKKDAYIEALNKHTKQFKEALRLVEELDSLSKQFERTESSRRKQYIATQVDAQVDKYKALRLKILETIQEVTELVNDLYGAEPSRISELKRMLNSVSEFDKEVNAFVKDISDNNGSLSPALFTDQDNKTMEEQIEEVGNELKLVVQSHKDRTSWLHSKQKDINNFEATYNQALNAEASDEEIADFIKNVDHFDQTGRLFLEDGLKNYAKMIRLSNFLGLPEQELLQRESLMSWDRFKDNVMKTILQANFLKNNLVAKQNQDMISEQRTIDGLIEASEKVRNLADELEQLIQQVSRSPSLPPTFAANLKNTLDEVNNILIANPLPTDVRVSERVTQANSMLNKACERFATVYNQGEALLNREQERLEKTQLEERVLSVINKNNGQMRELVDTLNNVVTHFRNEIPNQEDIREMDSLLERVVNHHSVNLKEEEKLPNSTTKSIAALQQSDNLLARARRIRQETVEWLRQLLEEQTQSEVLDIGQDDPVTSEGSVTPEFLPVEHVVAYNNVTELIAPKSNKVVTALKLGVGKMNIKECTRSNSGSQETVYFPTMFTAEQGAKCGMLHDRLQRAGDILAKTGGQIDTFMLGFTYLGSTRLILKRANNFVFGPLKPLLESIVVSLPGETLARPYNLFQFLDNSLILEKGDSFASLARAFLLNSHLFEPMGESRQRVGIQQLAVEYDEGRLLEAIGMWLKRSLILLEIKKTVSLERPYEVNEKVFGLGEFTDKPPYFVLKTVNDGNVQYAALVPFVPGNSRGGVA